MSLTITFDLTEQDLEYFATIAADAKMAVEKGQLKEEDIISAVRELLDGFNRRKTLSDFVLGRIRNLQILVNMLGDSEWDMPKEQRYRVLGAMAYFTDSEDLIPDSVPGIGFLDDAIMVELITHEMEPELRGYTDFCQYRIAEQQRRKNVHDDTKVTYEDWLADRRATLHHRISDRITARTESSQPSLYGIKI